MRPRAAGDQNGRDNLGVTIDSRWVALDDKDNPVPPPGPEIDRVSATDLMELAADDSGDRPMQVGVILMLEKTPSLTELREILDQRVRAVPRLRKRLVRAPFGCGRPIWVDDPNFDISTHVSIIDCNYPGSESDVLYYAAELTAARLWHERPLWTSYLITQMKDRRSALLLVFHHVLADGIGGLAALSKLVDWVPPAPAVEFPRPRPRRRALFVDAWRTRIRSARHLLTGVRRLRAAATELGLTRKAVQAPKTSLNRPIGRHRQHAVARADLAAARDVGHRYNATVNDVVLTAIAGALGAVLRDRGENVEKLVVSVPVSARREADVTELGNQVGVIPVAVPVGGDPFERLTAIAEITRDRKTSTPGASATLLAPAFRTLGRLRLLRWYTRRQHRINTFVTNVRGPEERLTLLGVPITEVIPIGHTTGNVAVAFSVLSYAGKLTVTITAERDGTLNELPLLATELQAELETLTRPEEPAAQDH
jgi:WS/DGAT/MGAT family acyltransferase